MKKEETGQLLIEVLIALAVINLALVSLLSVSIKAIRVSRTSRNRLEAVKYAEGVIEGLKRTKETNQDSFFLTPSCPTCGPFGTNNMYTCSATCAWTSDRVTVKVTVSWTEGTNTPNVELESILTKAKL